VVAQLAERGRFLPQAKETNHGQERLAVQKN